MASCKHLPSVLALDAGGTMTDAFVVDKCGDFIIGKALSTPDDESHGVLSAFQDALKYWGVTLKDAASHLEATIYAGTAMLNRVLTRQGEGPIGLIVTAGFEQALRMERGVQAWLGLSYADRLHAVSHSHNESLVSPSFIKGVRERIDVFGQEMVPLYEHEARSAVASLLDQGVKTICVCLLFGFRNPSHELSIARIAEEVMQQRGVHVPVLLSCKHNPVRGELPRMQTLILEAFAAAPGRVQLQNIQAALKSSGCDAPLRALTCYGGSIPPEHEWMVSTMVSGPIGGITGAQYLGECTGIRNIVCSDVGGTSFDVALISDGRCSLDLEPAIARMKLALPSVEMNSVGAGTGMYVRLDPTIHRIELGPESAGFRIGMCVEEDIPTVNDCSAVLGYLNPDYFLGGDIQLDVSRAFEGIRAQLATPLGISVEEAAWGVWELVNTQMRDHLNAMILGRGFSPENYTLMSYGGGGPLHACGYLEGLRFENILVPTWAPAFSAFGCACADYSFRYDQQLDFPLSPDMREADELCMILNGIWKYLNARVREEVKKAGLDTAKLDFRAYVRMQYQGQLDDLEIESPAFPLNAGDLAELRRSFTDTYTKVFPASPQSPELGYCVTRAVAQGTLPTQRPRLERKPFVGHQPPGDSLKGQRPIFWRHEWHDAALLEMDRLEVGNRISGPAVVEAPATTFLIPPGLAATLNGLRIFEIYSIH